MNVTPNEFIAIVKKAKTIADVLDMLGYTRTGYNYKRVRDRMIEEKVSIIDDKWACGNHRIPLDEILVENSIYINRFRLKKRLVRENLLDYRCSADGCTVTDTWNGKILTLELDHINGINNDNRIENLRFLCPNCHMQTDTYGWKNVDTTK